MREYRKRGRELEFKECIFCGNERYNLSVNLELGVFKCWVCGEKGPLSRLNILLPLGVFDVLDSTLPNTPPPLLVLEECEDVIGTAGEDYLRGRGFQLREIVGWNIKYSNKGKIIFPLYDKDENLIYKVEKDITSGRYYYPKGVAKKDIVWAKAPFKKEHIILVEGLFDAIKVHSYGYNVMALLGTHVFEGDVNFIKQRKLKPVLMLDEDVKIETYKKIQKRLTEFEVTKLTDTRDPAELTKEEVDNLFETRMPFNLSNELRMRWK